MNEITTFLNNTNISVKDTLIISLIVGFIFYLSATILKPIPIKLWHLLVTNFQEVIGKIEIIFKHIQGNFCSREYKILTTKVENGITLTKKEQYYFDIYDEYIKALDAYFTDEQKNSLFKSIAEGTSQEFKIPNMKDFPSKYRK